MLPSLTPLEKEVMMNKPLAVVGVGWGMTVSFYLGLWDLRIEEICASFPRWSPGGELTEKWLCGLSTRVSREETPVPHVAERAPEVSWERARLLAIENQEWQIQWWLHWPDRRRESQRRPAKAGLPLGLWQSPREILQGHAGGHREMKVIKN